MKDARAAGWRSRWMWMAVAVLSGMMMASCGGGGGGDENAPTAGSGGNGSPASGAPQTAAPASVQKTLDVPASLADGLFTEPRTLTLPPGFSIRLWARVPNARFMALAPNGDVLVSIPDQGRIVLLRDQPDHIAQASDFATGLRRPHDMVFHTIGDTTYLYVAETNRVTRSVYRNGDIQRGAAETVVENLPDSSSPELGGGYGHELKNIALGPDHKLYVSIGSNCNACAEDALANPVRGAIYQYDADGGNGRLFARGLRNAEGLRFIPGTNVLWAAVNDRDQIRVPTDIDVDGDGNSDLGKIMPAYVDANPPELFTRIRDGGNYGWPYCNPLPNASMSDLEFAPDFETNRDQQAASCAAMDRSSKGIRAHSAPLGMSFLQNSGLPAAYRNGAAVALHGCWNCTSLRAGFKVIYFPFDSAGNAGAEIDLVSGFVTDPDSRAFWGRPVDVIPDANGNLLISDDFAGAIYQLYPSP